MEDLWGWIVKVFLESILAMARSPQVDIGIKHSDTGVYFDVPAFDNVITSHGVTMCHWAGIRCPVGLVDRNSGRRPHDDHEGCSNGFLYRYQGEVTCLFSGNSTTTNLNAPGLMDGSSVNITFPRFYDTDPDKFVYVANFDRLYFKEEKIQVVTWQLLEHSLTGSDRPQFPALCVLDLVDSRGVSYAEGIDFEVRAGLINWLGQNRPGLDPDSGRGRIYSVRYTYRPYYYVERLVHEVRVAQALNPVTGARESERVPVAAIINREYVAQKEDADPDAKNPSQRQTPSPGQGLFGPR